MSLNEKTPFTRNLITASHKMDDKGESEVATSKDPAEGDEMESFAKRAPTVTGYMLNILPSGDSADWDDVGHTTWKIGTTVIRMLGPPVVGDAVDFYHC